MSQAPFFINADATRIPLADDSVSLTMTSPPYMDARTYGINAHRNCEDWIAWMLPIVRELVRVTVGPVIVNCGGVTRDRTYWPGCEGLLYRAWQDGIGCYRPAYWYRVGIPGSGGKDWLRADVEYCLCFKRPGALPHFDVSKIGHPPKWAPGGEMSHRLGSGARVNQWGRVGGGGGRERDGTPKKAGRPSHRLSMVEKIELGGKSHTKRDAAPQANGEAMREQVYLPPSFANPGNVLKVKVGGGLMGHPAAHDNEAPFPEGVPEFFIKGWTKPGDVVFDPFSGSGTTACVAARMGRIGIGSDLRMSQCELGA